MLASEQKPTPCSCCLETDQARSTESVSATAIAAGAGEERKRRAWLSTVMASGFSYLMTAISFVAVPLYLQWLGVEAYGRFLTLLAFMGYLNFADAGLNWGAMVLIGQAHGRQNAVEVASLFRHAAVLAFLSAALAFTAALAVYFLSAAGYRLPMFRAGPNPGLGLLLVGLKSAFMLSTSCMMAMAYGLQEGFWFSRLQGYFQLLGAGLMLVAAYWLRSIDAVIAASTCASALACVATLWLGARRYGTYLAIKTGFSRETFRMQLRMGAKSFLLQGSRLVRTTAPLFLVASFAGSGEVPALTLPMTLLGVISGFLFNWSASLQTAYGEAWAKGDKPWIAATVRQVIERGLGWLLLAACLIVALGQTFVHVWTNGHVSVSLLMLGSAVSLVVAGWIADVIIFALVGINRQRMLAFVEILNVGLGLGAGWALGASGHIAWIGYGVLAAAFGSTMLVGRQQLRHWLETASFWPPLTTLLRFTAATASTAAVLFAASLWNAPAADTLRVWITMGVSGLTGVLIFFLSLRLVGLSAQQWPGFDWAARLRGRVGR